MDIVNGQIDLVLKGNTQLHLQNASLSIESKTLFDSRRIASLEESVNHLSFSKGLLQTRNFVLGIEDAHYLGDSSSLFAGRVTVSNKRKTMLGVATKVSINEINVNDSSGFVHVDGVRWQQADWKMTAPELKKGKNSVDITLQNIEGRNTTINTKVGERSIATHLNFLSVSKLWKEAGGKWQTNNLELEGSRLLTAGQHSTLSIDAYRLINRGNSFLTNLHFQSKDGADSIDLRLPQLTGKPDIPAILNGNLEVADLVLVNPSFHLSSSKTAGADPNIVFPSLNINKVRIESPDVEIDQSTSRGKIQIIWKDSSRQKINYLELEELKMANSGKNLLTAAKGRVQLDHFSFSGNNGKLFNSEKAELSAELRSISIEKNKEEPWKWSSVIESMGVANFSASSVGKRKGLLYLRSASLQELAINSTNIKKPAEWIKASDSFQFKDLTGSYFDSTDHFRWHGGNYNQEKKVLALDSFSYEPAQDHETFVASHPYQADDFRASTGKIKIEGLDLPGYFRDSILKIHTVRVADAVINDVRDLRPPFKAGILKPLPVQMLKNIPVKFSIDSILLTNAKSIYSELNAKSNETGTIPVTRMTIRFFPVRNYDLTATDSLRIQANGYLMDSIWVRLRVRESYTDSLSGFLMTVRMKPASLLVMNPVLIPLSSVKILSGYLDTLSLRAAGSEYLSYGEMKMHYRDLKIKFLKNGSETKKSFLSSLITFVANSFVIKNKNTSRMGRVFFIRLRDRSILNYLVKTTMSGIASSVGAKGNQKILRQYKKQLRARNLPPADYD